MAVKNRLLSQTVWVLKSLNFSLPQFPLSKIGIVYLIVSLRGFTEVLQTKYENGTHREKHCVSECEVLPPATRPPPMAQVENPTPAARRSPPVRPLQLLGLM